MPKKPTKPKPKVKITGKASTSGGAYTGGSLKLNEYGQPVKSKSSTKKSSPSLASQAGKVAGKVAGKAAGIAKSKVKADIKAAKTVAGFVAKQAMPPSSNPILKGAKAVGKALAKKPIPKRGVGKLGSPLKQMYSNKNIKKK